MRYNVGDRIPFVSVCFGGRNFMGNRYTNDSGVGMFCPWENNELRIVVEMMHCVAHHKVPEHFDPKQEPRCDGFIFHGDQQQVWHNQYPRASYGQLDNTNDRRVMHPEKYEFREDARAFLERIYRGIADLTEIGEPIKAAQLQDYFEEVQILVEAASEKMVEIRPLVLHFIDGHSEESTKIKQVVLIDYSD